ncbi:MAG: nitrilase-related carbon-nitrogen hydrolase [Verrucomicrobiota bacterium]
MKLLKDPQQPLSWWKSFLFAVLALVCFHLAYAPLQHPAFGLFIFGYAYFLVQLTNQKTVRRAFYFGLAVGFLCVAPQLNCLWEIFRAAAMVLWLVLAFWIGLFVAIVCACIRRWGKVRTMWLVPFIWTGLEYFRSELYYLKFSWLNVGYALPAQMSGFSAYHIGMYGLGFLAFAAVTIYFYQSLVKVSLAGTLLLVPIGAMIFLVWLTSFVQTKTRDRPTTPLTIAGVQLEFPTENILPEILDHALAKHTNAPIFVLSEYTLDGPVPESLKQWCREHSRFLVVGGKDPAGADNFYDTAFVVGTNGEIIFKQAKSVPIQFFEDGLPAQKQEVWNSPWGKIGICICYDLSYARVTDRLVKAGAQLLIVPTMDVEDWGRHEHELHARVAPVRAVEYGIPIFRLASSGISQAVSGNGRVVAQTSFPGSADILSATLQLPVRALLPIDRFPALYCVFVVGAVLILLTAISLLENHPKVRNDPSK